MIGATGNTIRGNRINQNGQLGIDLYPSGVTTNDAGDADSGPNNFQNYPLLASATSGSTSTMVSGTLNSLASTAFMLDFYASPTCDNSGNGQGAVYLGAGQVTTGADGNATFSLSVPTAATSGWAVTATATDPGGSTSEFSGCVTATQQAPALAKAGVARKAPASHGSNTLNKPFVSAPQELSAPIQIGPSGTGNTNPIYRWQPVATVTSYQLLVIDDADQTVIDRTYAADDVCQDSVCQTQSAPLAEGSYSWSVKGDITPSSAEMTFTAVAPVVSNSWHYEYDNLSRVTYACSQWDGAACTGNEFHYAYDGAGNLTRFDRWSASTASVETVRYVINGANQIACVDTDGNDECNDPEVTWQYDAYGNLLTDGTNTYVYDAANRLSSITNAAGTTTYTSYDYNGDGDRISQTVTEGSITTTTMYVLDTATPLTMVLSESTGGVTTRYWHGLDTLAQSNDTTTEYFAYDGLGSVRQLVGESGSVGLAQTFDAYGNGFSKAGSAGSSFGYSGEQVDANGFVFLRARYYNPAHGRFFQMDPSRQEKNAYLYSAGNPIMFTDPSGLLCLDPSAPSGFHLGSGGCDWPQRGELGYWSNSPGSLSKIWDLLTNANCRKEALIDMMLSIVVPFQRASDAAQRLKKDFIDGCQRCTTDPQAITRDWSTLLGYSFEVANTVMLPFEMAQLGASAAVGITNKLDDLARAYGDDVLRQSEGATVLRYSDDLVRGLCSFSSDTLVTTENGEEPIGSLHRGDKVLAYDAETGETSYQEIEAVLVHTDEIIEYLRLDDEVLTTTPEHPFFTAERGWVAAAELRIGEHVRRADGSYGVVNGILLVKNPQRMYNLTVAKAHTFFVGEGKWLVHNTCVNGQWVSGVGKTADDAQFGLPRTRGAHEAYEQRATHKPTRDLSVFVSDQPGQPFRRSNAVEFDWYYNDGQTITLLDAKQAGTNSIYRMGHSFRQEMVLWEGRRQIQAMDGLVTKYGQSMRIEWRVADRQVAADIRELFSLNRIDIQVRFYP